jgi:hypothetical protein
MSATICLVSACRGELAKIQEQRQLFFMMLCQHGSRRTSGRREHSRIKSTTRNGSSAAVDKILAGVANTRTRTLRTEKDKTEDEGGTKTKEVG